MPLGSLEAEMIQTYQPRMRAMSGFPVVGVGVWYNPVSWVIKSSERKDQYGNVVVEAKSAAVLNAEGQELDAKLRAFNDAKRAQLGEEWYRTAEANRQMGVIDAEDQITTAFIQGGAEGLSNVKTALNNFTGNAVGFAFGSINWKLWVVAGIAAFFWLGGHEATRRYVGRLG